MINKITVIGDGSWATAIIKMLLYRGISPGWLTRDKNRQEYILSHGRNPDFLSFLELDINSITFFDRMTNAVEESDMLIFVVPSVYLKNWTFDLPEDLSNKLIVSAIKGIIPDDNILIADFFTKNFKVDPGKYAVISGPSHSEIVAMEKLSYLTIAAGNRDTGEMLAERLRSDFIKASVNEDVYGTEYSAALKNIMAIAAGICHSLNYGDNFLSVLISNASQEMERFLDKADPRIRDIKGSSYLGDLLVTAYSQFSRNRTFGAMIGKGYSVKSAIMEMNMVAEGYHAVKCIHEMNRGIKARMPVTEAVYNILYEKIAPGIEIKLLTEQLS